MLDKLFNWVGANPLAALGFLVGASWLWIRFWEGIL